MSINKVNNNEIINTVETANVELNENVTVSQKSKTSRKMKKVSQSKEAQTIKVINRGKEISIIPVIDPRMRTPEQWKNNALENKVDTSLRFKRNYQFNRVDEFIKEERLLINLLTGQKVTEFEEEMLLFIPTIETTKEFLVNQIYLSEKIDIVINDFTVEECFKALAGDEVMAAPASNKDWLNWTCEVTKEQLLINVRNLMEEFEIKNITSAFKYFNAVPTMRQLKLGAIANKFPTMESRLPEVAQEIYDVVFAKFGKQVSDNRYVVDCINKKCAEGYNLENILTAIKALDLVAVRTMTVRGLGCLDKEECISNEVTVKLQELGFKAELKRKAA